MQSQPAKPPFLAPKPSAPRSAAPELVCQLLRVTARQWGLRMRVPQAVMAPQPCWALA